MTTKKTGKNEPDIYEQQTRQHLEKLVLEKNNVRQEKEDREVDVAHKTNERNPENQNYHTHYGNSYSLSNERYPTTDDRWLKYDLAKIYGASRITAPEFNYTETLRKAIESPGASNCPQDSLNDLLRTIYEANSHPEKIIEAILPAAQKNGVKYSDGEYECSIENHDHSSNGIRKVRWCKKNRSKSGNTVFSLIMQIKKCTDEEAFSFAAKTLKALEKTEANYTFISDSETYDCKTSILAKNILELIDQVAGQSKQYTFTNEFVNHSFKLLMWRYKDQYIYLFLTLQKNKKADTPAYELLEPPLEYLIDAGNGKEVHIHDNIENVVASNDKKTIGAWAGDLALASKLDWTILKGRKVKYFFDRNNPDSFLIGGHLLQTFREMSTDLDIRERNRVGIRTGRPVTEEEFYKMAQDLHGLNLKSEEKNLTSGSMTLEELMNMKFKKRPFILKHLFKEGQTIMIKAKRKHFKSWIGYEIAACVASGGSMGGRFHAPNASVVHLVDAEMPTDELQGRFQSIMSLYENQSLLSKNLIVTSLEFENKNLDLTSDKDQTWLEELTIDAKVIVLDNLGLLMPDGAVSYVKNWRIVRNWTKKMNKQGKSVVIIHHETKEGKTGGTAKIEDDLDLVIALKKPENQESTEYDVIEFRFEACRYLKGDEKAPFYIRYYEENGLFKRDIEMMDVKTGKPEPIKVGISEEEIQKYNLDSELKIEIFTAAIAGEIFKRITFENGEKKGYSPSTVKNCLKELCDDNILERKGYKYQLHPDLKKIYE